MSELYELLKNNLDHTGLPVMEQNLFKHTTEKYGKEEFRKTLAEFITNEKLDKLRETYTSSGTPKFYTIVGQELEVLPVPDSATLTGEITYYSKIPNLTDVSPTNWLMNSSPDIYLYGSLLQSAPYLVDDSRIPVWASMYQKLVKDLEIADQKARVGDSTLKMKATALQ